MISIILTACIRLYQLTFAHIIPRSCRFYPSCSEYAIQAIRVHGPLIGMIKGIGRICRCHPFHPGGYDPVQE